MCGSTTHVHRYWCRCQWWSELHWRSLQTGPPRWVESAASPDWLHTQSPALPLLTERCEPPASVSEALVVTSHGEPFTGQSHCNCFNYFCPTESGIKRMTTQEYSWDVYVCLSGTGPELKGVCLTWEPLCLRKIFLGICIWPTLPFSCPEHNLHG